MAKKKDAWKNHLMDFLKFNKRKALVLTILFFIVFIYFPAIECIEDHAVKEKFCKEYHQCEVDYYYTILKLIINFDMQSGTFDCPATNVTIPHIASIIVTMILLSYIIASTIDYLYVRFRDI